MSYNYIGAAGAIKTGNRTTRIFPSGLCCIQEQWVTRKGGGPGISEGSILADSSPCIDNAYVFPAPEANEQGDGFTRWSVTAYGRVNTQGATRYNRTIVNLGTQTAVQTVQIENPVVTLVLPTTGAPNLAYGGEIKMFDSEGNLISQIVVDGIAYVVSPRLDRVDSVAYGFWTEYNISYSGTLVAS